MSVSYITCATKGCGYSPFPMDEGFEQRARRTHETFYCPAGHSLHFGGESDHERTVRELKEEHGREVRRLERHIRAWEEGFDRWRETALQCPWPTCRERVYSSRDSLYDHMRRTHQMPTMALVQEAS